MTSTYAQQQAAAEQQYRAIQIDQGIRHQGADALASLFDSTHETDVAEQVAQAMTEAHAARVIRDAQAAAATTADQHRAETDRAVLAELFGEQPPAT